MAFRRFCLTAVLAAALGSGAPTAATAQEAAPYRNVVSANPFGLLLDLFNAEYERVITESSSAGIGGSYFSTDDEDYLNLDAFWRFYVQGTPLEGWAFGVKLGITQADLTADGVDNDETYLGYGFDANYSWLLGRRDNFYVGLGFGLKRLIDADEADIELVPTLRIINIGFAF